MDVQDLTQYGTLGVAAFAVLQLSKFVAAVSGFLTKLDASWQEQASHRKQEREHWAQVERHHEQVERKLGLSQ